MFYDKFKHLCELKGVSCNKAATEIGLSNATPTMWKKRGLTPKGETLTKVADYFGVSVGDLLGDSAAISSALDIAYNAVYREQKEKAAIDVIDDDLAEYLDELRNRPEKRLLFSVTKNATKSQIEAIVKMIEEMQGKQ